MKPSTHFRHNAAAVFRIMEEAIENGLQEVSDRAVAQTPVDTGDSRNNWQGVRTLADVTPFVEGKKTNDVGTQISRILKMSNSVRPELLVKELYIVNPAPYALDYELGRYPQGTGSPKTTPEGYSTQAPSGVVGAFEKEDGQTLANAIKYAFGG